MRYDAVIFDNDGVLTTPTRREVLRTAIEETLGEFGVASPDPEHVETMVATDHETAATLCSEYGIDAEAFWPARDRNVTRVHQEEIAAGRKTLYDDVALLEEFAVPMGIVSNNQHTTIEYLVEYFEFDGVFETYYGRELTLQGLQRCKPNPHYLERAIADLQSERPLYVGDSRSDVAVADRLEIDSAFVRRPHREEYVIDPEPTYEIASFEELRSVLDVERAGSKTSGVQT